MRTLAQISESAATGDLKALYDDMRRVVRTPLVNLIYRHMATMPGALPWAWSLIRPLALAGVIQSGIDRLVAELATPSLTPITTPGLRSAGLDAAEERRALRVIAAYNRGNTFNLISLTTLRLALDGDIAHRAAPPFAPAPTDALPEIPPIVRASDLDPRTAAQLERIAQYHSGDGVLPSFYLHLANWPELLAVVCQRLEPVLADGSIERAREDARQLARDEATNLAPLLATDIPTPVDYLPALREALDTFAGHLIPEMVPVGLAVWEAMPRHAERD